VEKNIKEKFQDERIFTVSERPWFLDITNFKASKMIHENYTWQQKQRFLKEPNHYLRGDPYILRIRIGGLLCRCVRSKES